MSCHSWMILWKQSTTTTSAAVLTKLTKLRSNVTFSEQVFLLPINHGEMATWADFQTYYCKLILENRDEIEQENDSFGGKIFESLW